MAVMSVISPAGGHTSLKKATLNVNQSASPTEFSSQSNRRSRLFHRVTSDGVVVVLKLFGRPTEVSPTMHSTPAARPWQFLSACRVSGPSQCPSTESPFFRTLSILIVFRFAHLSELSPFSISHRPSRFDLRGLHNAFLPPAA